MEMHLKINFNTQYTHNICSSGINTTYTYTFNSTHHEDPAGDAAQDASEDGARSRLSQGIEGQVEHLQSLVALQNLHTVATTTYEQSKYTFIRQ